MKTAISAFALLLACAAPANAQTSAPNPQVDYEGFSGLTRDLATVRADRLLGWAQFTRAARARGALLLDARSADAYARGHLAGAVNLPFTDFTDEALARVIGPDRNRPIYIYCNNNFTNNRRPVVTKALPLALNIQTFINLYGYGYKNVWELGEAVDMDDPVVGWVSAAT